MSNKRSDSKPTATPAARSDWNGTERRRSEDRRSGDRRLDERRAAGIGEIMDERRHRSGRRRTDRRNRPTRRTDES